MGRRDIRLGFGVAIVAVVAVAGLWVLRTWQDVARSVQRTASEDNLRTILWGLRNSDGEIPPEVLRHTGRNFILTTVASGAVDPMREGALDVLWPPGADVPSRDAYRELTWEGLERRRWPHLTGYAGPSGLPPGPDAPEDRPLIADLTLDDGILVGFARGIVRFFTWDDLGIDPPGGAPRVGREATHPILRALSND